MDKEPGSYCPWGHKELDMTELNVAQNMNFLLPNSDKLKKSGKPLDHSGMT